MIELSETKDYHLIATLNEEIQSLHHHWYPSVFKPYNNLEVTKFFQETLSKDNAKVFIAKENDTVVGYVLIFIIHFAGNPFQYARDYISIDQVLVLNSHRSKGIGKLLIEKTIDLAKSLNINTIELNHWSLNHSGRSFFNKVGFTYFNEKMALNL